MKVCGGFFSVCSSIMQPESIMSAYHCRVGYSIPQGSSAVGKSLSETFFDQGVIIFNIMLCSKDCIGCAGLSCF